MYYYLYEYKFLYTHIFLDPVSSFEPWLAMSIVIYINDDNNRETNKK